MTHRFKGKNRKIFVGVFFILIFLSIKASVLENTNSLEVPRINALSEPVIADHSVIDYVRLDLINESAINTSKSNLHIAYGHTSHGSQIITGMNNLPAFKEGLGGTPGLYDWNDGPEEGKLDIDDYFASGDLGHNGNLAWEESTRTYLANGNHNDVNVIMWSWCGGVSDNTEDGINTYLNAMYQLEIDFPNIFFVYMTGHADGTGEDGNLHIRNQQIRDYCETNNKILFDFYDIECYNPDGNYFGDKDVNDNCDYDSDGNGSLDANWADEWQESHTEDEDWYSCSAAHSKALNGNQKAYAAWWLWARLGGWVSEGINTSGTSGNDGDDDETITIAFQGIYYISFAVPVLFYITRKKSTNVISEK